MSIGSQPLYPQFSQAKPILSQHLSSPTATRSPVTCRIIGAAYLYRHITPAPLFTLTAQRLSLIKLQNNKSSFLAGLVPMDSITPIPEGGVLAYVLATV
ncbi:MAG: hypothetical protein QW815_09020 [Nitrososphaerota archaeon]